MGTFDSDVSLETASGTGAYEWCPAEDRLVWSPGLLRIYGMSEAPHGEGEFSRLVHPEDRVRVEAETSGFLGSDASTYSHMFRIVRPDGNVRCVIDRGVIERDAHGRVQVIRGMNVDVTEHVSALQLTTRIDSRGSKEPSADHFLTSSSDRHLVDLIPAAVYACDVQGRLTFYNA